MAWKNRADCHTHSVHSMDGADSVMMLCDAAVKRRLRAVTVTDHCECNLYHTLGLDGMLRASYSDTKKAEAFYSGQLEVLFGVELGQPMHDPAVAEAALGCAEYDYVLASVHMVRNAPDFYDLDYRASDVPKLIDRYFEEVHEVIEWGRFDALAHLTYPLRYLPEDDPDDACQRCFYGHVEEAMRRLARAGKALEVNTSGLRTAKRETLPGFSVIKMFHDLGGAYVTLGSDAHRWPDVGEGIETGMTLLKKAGFDTYTVYRRRAPCQLVIE